MDYPKFAIFTWIIATIVIAISCRKAFFKIFGMPKNRYLKVEWRAFLFTAALLGAAISTGITLLIKSFS